MSDARGGRRGASTAREALSWMTWGDRALVVVLIAVSVGAILAAPKARGGAVAQVRVQGREAARLSLAEEGRATVTGPLGETEIAVEKGAARIVRAPCRRKVCIRMGAASRTGQVLVCVPNEVVVEVDGGGEEVEFDAILR